MFVDFDVEYFFQLNEKIYDCRERVVYSLNSMESQNQTIVTLHRFMSMSNEKFYVT